MDRELAQRQVDFYRQEIANLKGKLLDKDQKILEGEKSLSHYEKQKCTIVKLKADVIRLKELLMENDKYKVFASKVEYKHYLGKPHKEHECWFSQNLVEDV